MIAKFSNLKIPFHIDISTGDIITPRAIEYKYKMILEDEYINIWTYNQETIVAEKLQTILARKIENSRMKDFYDIYYFMTFRWNEIQATFTKRETLSDIENIEQIIKTLSEDKNLKMLWKDYQDKFKYAKNVKYEETIKAIEFIKNIII